MQIRNDNDPDPWYCTFGVNTQDVDNDVQIIGERAIQAFTIWMDLFSTDVVLEGAQVAAGAVLAEPPIRAFVPADQELRGTHNVPKLPQNCALLVKKQTALGGKQHRGRFFLPGMLTEEGVNNIGVIDAGDRGSYQTHANTMLATMNASLTLLPMVILHNSTPTPVPDPTPVTSLFVDNVISTQRRRLR